MRESLDKLRSRIPGLPDPAREPEPPEPAFAPLRALAAQLLLVTGAGVTLDSLARARRERRRSDARPLDYAEAPPPRTAYAATWGPSLVAPLAATAHLTHLARPSESTTRATRVLNAAVIGMGVATLARDLLARGGRPPSLAPLALASAGLLGLVLDRQEHSAREERRRLERRASVVERLVPQRRRKLDRVVVHV